MLELSDIPELQTLIAAAKPQGTRPDSATVVAALLKVEKAAKQQRLSYPIDRLLGQWQLCFTTGTRKLRRGGIALSRGFYLPRFVQAQIGFERVANAPNQLQITNQLKLGAICFRVMGPAKYLPKKTLLAFDFTQMELSLLGRTLYHGNFRGGEAQAAAFDQQPVAKLPFFSFFLITDNFVAARGRGGGLAIWVS